MRPSQNEIDDLRQKAQLLLATGAEDRLMRLAPQTVLGLLDTIDELEDELVAVDELQESELGVIEKQHEREMASLEAEIEDLRGIIEGEAP